MTMNGPNTGENWPATRSKPEQALRVSVTNAKGQLTELVRRAKAGDDVILTRHGHRRAERGVQPGRLL